MIKLELPPKPTQLTDEFQTIKTQEFVESGKTKNVWNVDWLKDAVFQMAFGKCCYSEIRLGEESKYMEVEHYHHKVKYYDEVMLWGNLLPACKKCNATKGKHDTVSEPIVNPFEDRPKEHLIFKNYRYFPLNSKGKTTIDVLALNDRDHFVNPRFKIGNKLAEELEDLYENIDALNIPRKNARYLHRLKSLFKQGGKQEEYAALVSTVILQDVNYQKIEIELKIKSLWDDELESLKQELLFCALL
jgi:hypothetical protein